MIPYLAAGAAAYGVYAGHHYLAYGGIIVLLLFGCGGTAGLSQPSFISQFQFGQ